MIRMETRFVSATWCKACAKIKEPFINHCKALGIEPEWIDYDSMTEEDQATIKSLPTMMVREAGKPWIYYIASEFESWKSTITSFSLASIMEKTTDF